MKNTKNFSILPCNKGFTLVELMIALAVGGIVVGTIYSVFNVQRKLSFTQEAVDEMQQNIRVAMLVISRDLRTAGSDPTESGSFGFQLNETYDNGAGLNEAVTTDATNIAFLSDLDGDGSVDRNPEDINADGSTDISEIEQIAYKINNNNLERYSSTTGAIGWHVLAENIEGIEFNYFLEDGTSTIAPTATDLNDIRSVQISILARAGRPDYQFTNTLLYCPGSNPSVPGSDPQQCVNADPDWGPFNDELRRRLLTFTVQCRNMGV